MKEKRLLLGAHMSTAGGLELAFDRGEEIDCACIQIFTKSNRQWHAKPLSEQQIATFKKRAQSSSISPVVAHASYLINVGSSNEKIHKKSVDALKIELKRCDQLGIDYLVLHPGSAGTETIDNCIEKIGKTLNQLLKHKYTTKLLIENTAGQGSAVGYTFEQLKAIYNQIENKKAIGICFDTCHAFAAGYDFRSQASYISMWNEFEKHFNINDIKVFHINDSKKELGTRVDRHEHIGKGKIGLEGFKLLFNDPRFYNIPKILETPKERKDDLEYAKNMETIRSLLDPETKKNLNVEK